MSTAPASETERAAPAMPEVGTIIDKRFELLQSIGEGGMGQVFLARDLHHSCRVALKLLIPRYVGRPEREARLFREASMIERASPHPNLVRVIESGRIGPHKWPYMAMELIEGKDLAGRLTFEGALDPMEAAKLLRQIASAVRALHRAGIVHRDVTPMNVLLAADRAVLIDLSHAGEIDAPQVAAGQVGRLTQMNEVPGTHHYMSVEQAQVLPADTSMDIYALGVTMVYALTGEAPRGYDRGSFIAMQQQGLIESPKVDLSIHTAVPKPLARLANACTDRDPAQRPSIDVVLARLDAVLEQSQREGGTVVPMPSRGRVSDDKTQAYDHEDVVRITRRSADPRGVAAIVDAATAPTFVPPVAREATAAAEPPHEGSKQRWIIVALALLLLATVGVALWLWSQLPDGMPSAEPPASQPRTEAISLRGSTSGEGEQQSASTETGDVDGSTSIVHETDSEGTGETPIEPAGATSTGPAPTDDAGAQTPMPADPKGPRKGPRKPARPAPAPCIDPAPQARQAAAAGAWKKTLGLTADGRCWKSSNLRWSLRATALYRLGRYDECVAAAKHSTAAASKRLASVCRTAADRKTNP